MKRLIPVFLFRQRKFLFKIICLLFQNDSLTTRHGWPKKVLKNCPVYWKIQLEWKFARAFTMHRKWYLLHLKVSSHACLRDFCARLPETLRPFFPCLPHFCPLISHHLVSHLAFLSPFEPLSPCYGVFFLFAIVRWCVRLPGTMSHSLFPSWLPFPLFCWVVRPPARSLVSVRHHFVFPLLWLPSTWLLHHRHEDGSKVQWASCKWRWLCDMTTSSVTLPVASFPKKNIRVFRHA